MLKIFVKTSVTHPINNFDRDRPKILEICFFLSQTSIQILPENPKRALLLLVPGEQIPKMAQIFLTFRFELSILPEHDAVIAWDPSLLNLLFCIWGSHRSRSTKISLLPFPYPLSQPNRIESWSLYPEIFPIFPFTFNLTFSNYLHILNLL